MPIPVTCFKCGGKFSAPDHAAGRETKCPRCEGKLTVPNDTPEATDDKGALTDAPEEATRRAPQSQPEEPSAITFSSFLRQAKSGFDYTWIRYSGTLLFYFIIGAVITYPLTMILNGIIQLAMPSRAAFPYFVF